MSSFVHYGDRAPLAPSKDPEETLWYGIAWDRELDPEVSITESVWEVEAPGATADALKVLNTRPPETAAVDGQHYQFVTKALLEGGLVGPIYTVTNRVTLTNSQVLERSFRLRVRQK